MNNQIKEEGLTDAYLLGKYDGIKQGRADAIQEQKEFWEMQNNFAYEQGRTDKYQEIVSEYMLLTEEQVAEIRADAIDEVINKCSKEYQAFSDDTVCKIWLSDLKKLKEQK